MLTSPACKQRYEKNSIYPRVRQVPTARSQFANRIAGSGGSHKLGTLLVGDEYTVRSKTNMNVHGFRAVREKVMILREIAIGVEFAQPMVHARPRPSSIYSQSFAD